MTPGKEFRKIALKKLRFFKIHENDIINFRIFFNDDLKLFEYNTVQKTKTLRKNAEKYFVHMSLIVAWSKQVQGLNSLNFTRSIPHGVPIMTCDWPSTLLLCHVVDPARYYYAMWLTQYVIIMSCGWPSTSLLCHVVDPARYYYDMWLTQHVIIMTYGWPSTLLLCHVVYPACYYYDMWLTQHVIIMTCGWPSTLSLCHVVDPARYYYNMWLIQHVIIMTCGWPSTLLLWHVVDPARYYYVSCE